MENLTIDRTKSTPDVDFDPGTHKLTIRGQSYPENAFQFFDPLFQWLEAYLLEVSDKDRILFELQLSYINTSSAKCFMMLLEMMEKAYNDGKNIRIVWLYDQDNESELECAEEFKEDLTLPFEITSIAE